MSKLKHGDSDYKKGAVEGGDAEQTSLGGQLGHRDEDEMIKDSDSDFPEPGSSPEHTGERK